MIRSCQVNCPAGVDGDVSQAGMPAPGFRIPMGLPIPSPVIIAVLIVLRNAQLTFVSIQFSMSTDASSKMSRDVQTMKRIVSGFSSSSPRPRVRSPAGLLAKQSVAHAHAASISRASSTMNLIDGPLIVMFCISPATSVMSSRHDSTRDDISVGRMKPDEPRLNDVNALRWSSGSVPASVVFSSPRTPRIAFDASTIWSSVGLNGCSGSRLGTRKKCFNSSSPSAAFRLASSENSGPPGRPTFFDSVSIAVSSDCAFVACAAMSALMRSILAVTSPTDFDPFSISARSSASAPMRASSALAISPRAVWISFSSSAMRSSTVDMGQPHVVNEAANGLCQSGTLVFGWHAAEPVDRMNAQRAAFVAAQRVKALLDHDVNFAVVKAGVGQPFVKLGRRPQQRFDGAHARPAVGGDGDNAAFNQGCLFDPADPGGFVEQHSAFADPIADADPGQKALFHQRVGFAAQRDRQGYVAFDAQVLAVLFERGPAADALRADMVAQQRDVLGNDLAERARFDHVVDQVNVAGRRNAGEMRDFVAVRDGLRLQPAQRHVGKQHCAHPRRRWGQTIVLFPEAVKSAPADPVRGAVAGPPPR